MIESSRLILRRWKPEDREPFAALNASPVVTEFLPKPLTRTESDELLDRIEAHFEARGFGLFAVERKDSGACIGWTGLSVPRFEAPFMPAVEIGWRLAEEHWGYGFATEAARRALDFGFTDLDLKEIVSFTVPANRRSRSVMERLGMTRDPADDFDHPLLEPGHPLSRHVLYRLRREASR
ncbi:GNAT family N-acetyltransferase [Nisaea acidiphila]|uniref:GNAT family N-acetyltransferase n=1 Tax=Nisaea acidiphila TaxID=1862145 RepID=A0A9J7AMQ6_9PROT|nr:GNAT family N-acetyltransferase [Nisaea acidiphila]UUX48446.1 GNAT family N-acetyltransferase [Nisaea acidiphila]